MRILVTGGAGFIGSHIVDRLRANGHEAVVVDNFSSGSRDNLPKDVRVFEMDLCDADGIAGVFNEVKPDGVCHQAAQISVSRSVREPSVDAETNILAMVRLLENSVRVGVKRFVFASSGGVLYGDVFIPAGENHPAAPVSPYGISKWAGEQYLKFFASEHDIEAVAMRYSNVYGPRQNPHGEAGVVAIFCEKSLDGQPLTINGDGKYDRDYVFVRDVAAANTFAFEAKLPHRFIPLNVGTGVVTDVNQLEALVREEINQCRKRAGITEELPQPVYGAPRAGDLRSSVISAERIGRVLGWKPQVAITEGIQETAQWFAAKAGLKAD